MIIRNSISDRQTGIPIRNKILVTGANGQLGQELRTIAESYTLHDFEFHDRNTLDISSLESISDVISHSKPHYVINCAAYTKVDQAEDEKELAFALNSMALEHLSEACNKIGATLFHISSDYVYDSIKDRPLKENDPLEPKSVYAHSKKSGEEVVQKLTKQWVIIRTSWVYSSYGNNFVKTMLKLGSIRDKLSIVADQIGSPTYARDLAEIVINMIDRISSDGDTALLTNEIYNFSNSGYTSWDDFARKIFELSDIDCQVTGISTETYGAKAARPLWSVLSKKKIESALGKEIRNWESALLDCLSLLRK